MMLSSYWLGQKYYPIPYAVKKLIAYITMVVLIYFMHMALVKWVSASLLFSLSTGLVFFIFFTWFVAKIEAKELAKMPFIGQYFSK